ncbi:triphosphoribosyl-dephospho-CoA synthase CitG [Tatumella sp. JGM130]|uniref:triphosphoribosyl-dephospho-CoA synthase CitG n=1 Tax=Tatumella sp. JGM130 TaxID=2799797 RepID=UPI001BAE8827|nr:triphosphoribosyl-dephospho-CoA synthase CitG [Tatumella sp. JGM130]MBS0893374.1 triphosphoribosyl-dephospho-CoA synthase CitG [Tatumella sp. JGM130]
MTGLPVDNGSFTLLPQKVIAALQDELDLTPKPGLVDRNNSGSHHDMDYDLFRQSISAISPWFRVFEQLGYSNASLPAERQLLLLRPAGQACEQAMFSATGQVNTHQGGIFSLGLLCCAAGRLAGRQEAVSALALCRETSAICRGIVDRELAAGRNASPSAIRLFRQYKLTGARGEAESGFLTVRRYVLPFWHQETGKRQHHHALLRLMSVNADTNLVSRGGMAGLGFVRNYARKILSGAWGADELNNMDQQLISRHLSPGGSADLLAVAIVLAGLM